MRIDKIREEDLDGEVKTYKLNTIKQKIVLNQKYLTFLC